MMKSTPTAASRGLSGSTLKIIAIITMLLDHIGASLVQPILASTASAAGVTDWSMPSLAAACPGAAIPYYALRYIGRISFPIFCFLLVEGFLHTKNLHKYCLRLAIFALVSEIPFDLAFHQTPFYQASQNVFFTLLIGLLVISFDRFCRERFANNLGAGFLLPLLGLIAGMYLAEAFCTDYGYLGVLVIDILYILRDKRALAGILSTVFLCFSAPIEVTAIVFVPLIQRYNGKRGLPLKYVFYAFYPLHLLLLYILRSGAF